MTNPTNALRRRARALFAAGLLVATAMLSASPAVAQTFPQAPVRMIVPFPAGGPSDVAARTLARSLEKTWGQPVVIDNRPGANGAIAAKAAQNAAADGYTLLWATSSTLAVSYRQSAQAPAADAEFVPVSSVGRFGFGLYVASAVPAASVAELIAYGRTHPGQLNVATSNLAESMAAIQFMKSSGLSMVRVPYKGAQQVMPDLLEGMVQVNFVPIAAGLEHARAGKLRLLATSLPARSSATPDVPTMAEAGLPEVSVSGWQFVVAPPRTPAPLADAISRIVGQALQDADVRAQYDRQLLQIEPGTPAETAQLVKNEMRTWDAFLRENAGQLE